MNFQFLFKNYVTVKKNGADLKVDESQNAEREIPFRF